MEQVVTTSPSVTEYTIEREWRVLVTLAQAYNPAYACETLNWLPMLFSDKVAAEVFTTLTKTKRQTTLALPAELDGLRPYSVVEMKVARDRMFARASMENIIPDFQANLGDALAKIALDVERPDANKTDEEKEKKLASEIEAIIRAVKKGGESLALAASASPTQRKIQSTLGDLTRVYWEKANELSNPVGTGIAGLDRVMSGGLHAGRLLVLLAGPGAGKTSLANQIAEHVSWKGRPVVYVSTEEAIGTLQGKTLARLGRINYSDVLRGTEACRAKIDAGLALMVARESAERLLYLEESGADLESMKEIAMEHFGRYNEDNGGGPGVIVIDYLQKMARAICKATGQEMRVVVGTLCEDLRSMARMLNCTVIVLGALNRASGYDNTNIMSGGKDRATLSTVPM